MNKKNIFVVSAIVILGISIILFLTIKKSPDLYGSGLIEVHEVEVATRVTGQIKKLNVHEGDFVEEGDTLVIIEHQELLAQKQEALASVDIAKQTIKEIELTKKDLEKNLQRIHNLYVTGDVPEKELENYEMRLQILITQEDKARAGLAVAQARLNLIQTQIENTYILSPLSGVVLTKNYETGELVLTGSRLLKIGDLSSAWLKVYLPGKDIGKISFGAQARVYVDAYPKEVFFGKVIWISSEAEFTPKNIQTKEERTGLVFAIKITIPNSNQKLLPGMPADAEIIANVHR